MISEVLSRVLSEYPTAKGGPFGGSPLASYLRGEGALGVSRSLGEFGHGLLVEGSAGAGNWATVPWISVFDPVVTDSATRGYYVVYLFHAQQPRVFLSLNQGTTAVREEFGATTRDVLRGRAQLMRQRVSDYVAALPLTDIDLGSNARLPGDYVAGHALGIQYDLDALPTEGDLRRDLTAAVGAYRALTYRGGLDPSAEDEAPGVLESASLEEIRRYKLHRRIERNSRAAKLAKKHHGTRCQCCALNFGTLWSDWYRLH
jgi:5-methylcytosine-specific restriction protein A